MKYQIIHDTPGRMRLRCGQYAFTKEQARGMTSLLLLTNFVEDAVVNAANGSILIYYKQESKREILLALENLDRAKLLISSAVSAEELALAQIDIQFKKEFAMLFIKRYVVRWILPAPLRIVKTIWNALKYWSKGIESLTKGKLDVAVLDAASISAAMFQGAFSTANSIMFFLKLSELLEDYTRRRTKSVLAHSLAINVDRVWLAMENGEDVLIPISQLSVGDHIRVRMGGMIPVDGTVAEGEALVNEASMTGESLSGLKRSGSSVFAGTALEEGDLTIKVTAFSGETRINKIINLIDKSETLKAGVQGRAEFFADKIVPFSLLGAIAAGIFTGSITKALSVLMVDYSCAIKLSTPICIISAMREAAGKKIMVKGGKYLEAFAEADIIVFDKTGTLTEACPKVEKVISLSDYTQDEVLTIAACIEEHFPHSMARAVVESAKEKRLRHEEEHAEVEYIVAHGVATSLYGNRVLIGSQHFIFDDEKTEFTDEQIKQLAEEGEGYSLLFLAVAGKLAGAIAINDPPRPEAAMAISKLKQLGIQRVVMLTGDSEQAAKAVCKQLGIFEYRAQVLPEDKAALIEIYKKEGRKLIMVGDGINDSPALAAADVSVAMKDASDIARETADIALLSADLNELVVLRILSQKLIKRIYVNYALILLFNSGLLGAGLAGVLQPSTTALLHNTSTMGLCVASMRPCLPESIAAEVSNKQFNI